MENNLSEIIKNARENKKISQRELSRRTGIDNNTISQIEKGERKKPNSLSLLKLSQELDLDYEQLMITCGYTEKDIEITRMFNSVANEINFDENMLENVEESIEIHEKVINYIIEGKKNRSDPAYKNMSKEDIEFFDCQSEEIIKMNQELLKMYRKRAKFLRDRMKR